MPTSVRYDEVAPTYDRRYAEYEYGGIEALLDDFLERRHLALEVGCGTGHWVERMRARASRSFGLDPSAGMLGKAVDRLGPAGLVLGRAEALPLRQDTLDRVIAINALHHFTDPAAFAREAARVLRAQGRVAIIGLDVCPDTSWFIYDHFPRTRSLDMERYPTTEMITQWLQEAGFEDCETRLAHRITLNASARDYLSRNLIGKHVTSQLSLLSDDEYDEGMASIRNAAFQAEERGEDMRLKADLRLSAVLGTLPNG
jgi:ubiquinone/menaquinone biosynthesis C-methylase UbiE